MNRRRVTTISLILLTATVLCGPGVVRAQGKIDPDPASPGHDLSFELPKDGIARGEYSSEPFYAVILWTAKPCSVTEQERLRAQALLPKNKVFSTRFECDDEESITYTNVNPKLGFVAAFAGLTLPQAKKVLATVEATGQFPGANIRKMQAVQVYP